MLSPLYRIYRVTFSLVVLTGLLERFLGSRTMKQLAGNVMLNVELRSICIHALEPDSSKHIIKVFCVPFSFLNFSFNGVFV